MNSLINELLEGNDKLSIKQIGKWIEENSNYFNFLISETSCRKWYKWKNFNETPFPCVCPERELECVFIELYYNLLEVLEIAKLEVEFKKSVYEFYQNIDIDAWKEKHKSLEGKYLRSNPIKVKTNSEPYETIKINLDQNEFKYGLEFKELI